MQLFCWILMLNSQQMGINQVMLKYCQKYKGKLSKKKKMISMLFMMNSQYLHQHSLFFWKINKGFRACVVPKFHLGWKKYSIIWSIWTFYPVLKFHLGLAKPSKNFNSVYRVEIFTCNCNIILEDRGVNCLAEMKFQLGMPNWNFNPGWKSPYQLMHF